MRGATFRGRCSAVPGGCKSACRAFVSSPPARLDDARRGAELCWANSFSTGVNVLKGCGAKGPTAITAQWVSVIDPAPRNVNRQPKHTEDIAHLDDSTAFRGCLVTCSHRGALAGTSQVDELKKALALTQCERAGRYIDRFMICFDYTSLPFHAFR